MLFNLPCLTFPIDKIRIIRSIILFSQGIDHEDRQGKGHQNRKVEAAVEKIVDDLAERTQTEYHAEILFAVLGVLAALCDHEGKDGHGQPAQEPQTQYPRE